MRRRGLLSRIASAFGAAKRAYYAAAETNRLNKSLRAPMRVHPNTPASLDGPKVRAKLRQLGRDNPLVCGARRSFRSNVLPTAIIVEPDVKRGTAIKPSAAMNRNWNDPAGAMWKLWCSGHCDWFGWPSHADTFDAIQGKLAGLLPFDGEVFAIVRRRTTAPGVLPEFQIEIATSDRLDDARVSVGAGALFSGQRPGIEYDAQGRPAAYWFARAAANGALVGESERIPAADVIHVMVPNEPGEHVGDLPWASLVNGMQWLGETVQSELSIRAIMSRIAGIVSDPEFGESNGASDETDASGNPYQNIDMEDATIWRVPEGTELREFNMQRPGAQWESLVSTFLRWMSAGLGIPYSVLASDFRGLNYSVSRMEQLAAQPFLALWRSQIIGEQFVSRVYRRFVSECVAQGFLAVPGQLTVAELGAHKLRLPRTAYIDPLKDAQADLSRMRMGESPQKVFGERGLDFYEELGALKEAKDYAEGLGLHHLTIFAPEPGSTSAAITKQIEKDEQDAASQLPDVAPAERARRVA